MKRQTLLMLVVAGSWLMPLSSVMACTKDIDCKGDRICVEGSCQAPEASYASEPASTSGPTFSGDSSGQVASDKGSNFHINLLGLLQFGLTPSIEIGGATTVILRARILNSGVLPYVMSGLEDEDFLWGIGLGAQLRRYFSGQGAVGPYFGGGVELMATESEGSRVYETKSIVPQLEGGFRWDYGTWLLGVGVYFGAAIPVDANYDETETTIAGGFIVDTGFYF